MDFTDPLDLLQLAVHMRQTNAPEGLWQEWDRLVGHFVFGGFADSHHCSLCGLPQSPGLLPFIANDEGRLSA